MNPLLLVTLGLVVVLGGILWFKLHPFLALVLGAFVVGGLTSSDRLQQAMADHYLGERTRHEVQAELERRAEASGLSDEAELRKLVREDLRRHDERWRTLANDQAREFVASHTVLQRITVAMGNTFSKIGLLIAMACVVGRCLLVSGAAERIVRTTLAAVGDRGAPLAFSASSFVLSIPVFFDSVFLLVIPLAKATWLKLRKNYLLFVLALVTGGTMTHSLVPPTPGPLFVAEELGVNLGTMILVGMAVGLCCTAVGLAFAVWINRRIEIPVRDSPEALAELTSLAEQDQAALPGLALSLTPVLLPVLLISGATVYRSTLSVNESLPAVVALLGEKTIALTLAAVITLLMAARRLRDKASLAQAMQLAMQDAGSIILLCCAGGSFGAMLQQSGIGPEISSITGTRSLDFGLLPLAFLVTAVIRGAQGSSTVAMFTAVSIVRSIAPDVATLSYHPVYLAVAIGCGSKPFPWMNDSGFWVISRMSGMTEKETLQTHTPMVTLMGCVGIVVTMVGATLFPLVD